MTVVDLWTIQILADDGARLPIAYSPANIPKTMAETEENLTDLLPAGYRARIRRWDHPDPDEGDNPDE